MLASLVISLAILAGLAVLDRFFVGFPADDKTWLSVATIFVWGVWLVFPVVLYVHGR